LTNCEYESGTLKFTSILIDFTDSSGSDSDEENFDISGRSLDDQDPGEDEGDWAFVRDLGIGTVAPPVTEGRPTACNYVI